MIQLLTKVNIIDNSGGTVGRCIKILQPHGRDYAKVGDIILVSILDTARLSLKGKTGNSKTGPSTESKNTIKKGTMFKALVVRTKTNVVQNTARFDSNAVILLKSSGAPSSQKQVKLYDLPPIGTRVKGPISINLNKFTYTAKITSLSPRLV
jgi:ribosomal protein L14